MGLYAAPLQLNLPVTGRGQVTLLAICRFQLHPPSRRTALFSGSMRLGRIPDSPECAADIRVIHGPKHA